MDAVTIRLLANGSVVALAIALAALILVAGRRRGPEVWGAAWLLVLAIDIAGVTVALVATDAALFTYALALNGALGTAAPLLFLGFIGSLPGRATRRLRTPFARAAILVGALRLAIPHTLASTGFTVPVRTPDGGFDNGGSGIVAVVVSNMVFVPVGLWLLVRLRAERPRGTVERRRADALLLALAFAPGYLALQSAGMFVLDGISRELHAAYMASPLGFALLDVGIPASLGSGLCLLAYGILQAEVFDIDLRVRATVARGTLLGAFVLAFFVVEQVAETLLSEALGVVLGLFAAFLLVFLVRPLERGAERIAERVTPWVDDSAAFRDERREEVYRAALREALADGVLARAEEAQLAALASKLGLDPQRAWRIREDVERELRIAPPEGAAPG